jgi:hypothetical protein
MASALYRLGRGAFRRRRLVLVIWLTLLGAMLAGAMTLSGPTNGTFSMPRRHRDPLADPRERPSTPQTKQLVQDVRDRAAGLERELGAEVPSPARPPSTSTSSTGSAARSSPSSRSSSASRSSC